MPFNYYFWRNSTFGETLTDRNKLNLSNLLFICLIISGHLNEFMHLTFQYKN